MSTASFRATLPLVAVLLGTEHHRFDRLVRWTTELASVGSCTCFVQHGSTPLPALLPSGVDGAVLLEADGLADLLARAHAVVTHGGPAQVMAARAAGHRPIVVPRDPALDEHADAQQLRFASALARSGMAVRTDAQAEFERAVQEAVLAGRTEPSRERTSTLCDRFGELAERVAPVPRQRRPVR